MEVDRNVTGVSPKPQDAAVIDMGDVDDLAFIDQQYTTDDADGRLSVSTCSDYDDQYAALAALPAGTTYDGGDPRLRRQQQQQQEKGMMDEWKEGLAQNATSYLLLQGKERAQKAISTYANVDYLRPYFDVEPNVVLQRLFHSFIPINPFAKNMGTLTNELYGPTMLVFTLVAVLLFEMKMSEHRVPEGTLMGSALTTAFLYWFGLSATVMSFSYICNSHVRPVQVLSLVGYSLSGHCMVLFLGTLIHTKHDHLFFYSLWFIFGGLTAFKMVTVMMSRTSGYKERLTISCVIMTVHFLFLLYLHFAYHQVVQDLASIMQPNQAAGMVPPPAHSGPSLGAGPYPPGQGIALPDTKKVADKLSQLGNENLRPMGNVGLVEKSAADHVITTVVTVLAKSLNGSKI